MWLTPIVADALHHIELYVCVRLPCCKEREREVGAYVNHFYLSLHIRGQPELHPKHLSITYSFPVPTSKRTVLLI